MHHWSFDEAVGRLSLPTVDLDLGAARGVPLVVVEDAGDLARHPALDVLHRLPVVSVLVTPDRAPDPAVAAAFDTITDGTDLDTLAATVTSAPQAALTLCQVLRLHDRLLAPPTDRVAVHAGLVAESLAYASLQAGAEHRRWLDGQGRRVRRPDSTPAVLIDEDVDGVRLTLNRPRLRNALSAELRDALVDALRSLVVADDHRPVRLDAIGPSFGIGGDLAEFGTVTDPATAHQIRTTANVAPWLVALGDRLTVRIHGPCIGAGIELAAFASRVEARPGTTARLPELTMGLIPGAGGTVSLHRRLGRHPTARIVLTAATVDTDAALDLGLIDTVTDLR